MKEVEDGGQIIQSDISNSSMELMKKSLTECSRTREECALFVGDKSRVENRSTLTTTTKQNLSEDFYAEIVIGQLGCFEKIQTC